MVGSEGGIERVLSGAEAGFDESPVDVGGGEHCDAGVAMFVVVPVEEGVAVGAGVFDGAEAAGELGSVFESLELGLGVGGLSLETCGREWVLVTPRSARSRATGLDFIEEPRSA